MSSTKNFCGIVPALPTPFTSVGLDLEAFQRHLDMLKAADIQGVVLAGTTGESLTLSALERRTLIKTTRLAWSDVTLIAGVCAAHTVEAVAQAKQAQDEGSDALLVLPPYYVKPDTKGLDTFFETLLSATDLPVLLYNNPARLGYELSLEWITRWAAHPGIVGLKEASPHLSRVVALKTSCPDFALLSGDDTTFPGFIALGGDGVISVGANALPALYLQAWTAYTSDDLRTFATATRQLAAFHTHLASMPNPCGLKTCLAHLGLGSTYTRVPQTPLAPENTAALLKTLDSLHQQASAAKAS